MVNGFTVSCKLFYENLRNAHILRNNRMYENFYEISLRTLSTLLAPYTLCDLYLIYVN